LGVEEARAAWLVCWSLDWSCCCCLRGLWRTKVTDVVQFVGAVGAEEAQVGRMLDFARCQVRLQGQGIH
jgi:hypothetical protein